MQVTDEMVIKALSAWFNEPIDDPYPEHVDNMKAAIEAAIHWKQRALKTEEDAGENIKTLLLNIGANQMTTQYKWLPEKPTQEIINTIALNKNQRAVDIYKALWKAVPEVEQIQLKREPFSEDELQYVLSHFPESICNFEATELIRLVEKAHGIGV